MKLKISELLAQITVLEDELRMALREQESRFSYRIKGKRVEFESTVRIAHQKLKQRAVSNPKCNTLMFNCGP